MTTPTVDHIRRKKHNDSPKQDDNRGVVITENSTCLSKFGGTNTQLASINLYSRSISTRQSRLNSKNRYDAPIVNARSTLDAYLNDPPMAISAKQSQDIVKQKLQKLKPLQSSATPSKEQQHALRSFVQSMSPVGAVSMIKRNRSTQQRNNNIQNSSVNNN